MKYENKLQYFVIDSSLCECETTEDNLMLLGLISTPSVAETVSPNLTDSELVLNSCKSAKNSLFARIF